MVRARFMFFILAASFLGCASGQKKELSDLSLRVEELTRLQARQALRIEEITKNILAMHEKINLHEDGIETLKISAERAAEQPVLPLVKLSPPIPDSPNSFSPEPLQPPLEALWPEVRKEVDPSASDLYRRAFAAHKERRYGSAILDFEEFLRLYPDHEYSDNAQYWIGESYYSQGEYGQAIVEFNRVLDKYAHGDKASGALLKIGLSLSNMGDKQRSKVFLNRLISEYPQTDAALEAQKLLAGNP